MLKIHIVLECTTAIREDSGAVRYNPGERVELFNDIFDPKNGLAYFPLDKGWKIINMELIEYKPIKD